MVQHSKSKLAPRISVEALKGVTVLFKDDFYELAQLLLRFDDAKARGTNTKFRHTVMGVASAYTLLAQLDSEQVIPVVEKCGLPMGATVEHAAEVDQHKRRSGPKPLQPSPPPAGAIEKLIKLAQDIQVQGSAKLTRLTVLKKWFESPEHLASFAVFIAKQVIVGGSKSKTTAEVSKLFREARSLFRGVSEFTPKLPRQEAEALYERLQAFQNEYKHQQWGPVRIIRNWDLLLVEKGLRIYLWARHSPSEGYSLAADYSRHYDSKHFEALNGPSRDKILGIVRFMRKMEASEKVASRS